MELAITFIGWQFSVMLAHQKKPKPAPRLRVPTDEEIKAMIKERYRRFREVIKKQKQQD